LPKKLVKGDIPVVDTFFNCLTPKLSVVFLFFFFFSAAATSSADLLFGIPKVLTASGKRRLVDDKEADDEAADSDGVERLLPVLVLKPPKYASSFGKLEPARLLYQSRALIPHGLFTRVCKDAYL
jgi:hypothetical protein